jgi:hypothetical protein
MVGSGRPLKGGSMSDGEASPELVHAANFVRAESDRYFEDLVSRAGGVNRRITPREPAPIDHQPVVRMNRDAL